MPNILDKIKLSGTTYDIIDATAIHSMDGYWTSGQTQDAITAATGALAESIAEQHYQTSGDVQNAISGKADTTAVTQEISAAVSGKADTTAVTAINDTLTAHTANTDIHVTSADKTAWNAKADISDIPSVSEYADSVTYNSTSKYVEFYHGGTGGTKVFEYDASPFLIDGMVQNVEIKNVVGTQTLQTGYNRQTMKQNPYFIASNYDTSATNAVGDCSNFRFDSKTGARVLLKVFSSGGTETTVYNDSFTYNGTLPSSEYVTATYSNDTFTFVPAEGYRISTLNIFNTKNSDHMGMPEWNLCDLTVTAATTCLVITFNTDAGKQDINIPISQIFDASNYYTKSETNSRINESTSGKVSTYTYTAYTANTQSVLSGKADTTAVTQAISEAVSGKADVSTTVTNTRISADTQYGFTNLNAYKTINGTETLAGTFGGFHTDGSDGLIKDELGVLKVNTNVIQEKLVSNTNIKTVGGNSLLGSGDIAFPAGLQVQVSGSTLVFG